MNTKFDLNNISRDRQALLGVATLCILLCHSIVGSMPIEVPPMIRHFISYGNIGVDIFLFVSGVGMYYSLCGLSQTGGGYLFWYYKRFTRIAIPYSLLFIPFYILFHFADGLEWSNVIADYTTLTYWTNHRGFWYIAMLVPLYLLTPLLQILTGKGFRSLLTFLLVLIIVIMGPSDLDISNFRPNVLSDNIWFVVIRIPAYLFGYCLGPYIKGHREVSLIPIAALIIVISIMLRFHHFGPLYSYWMMWMPLAAIVIIVSLILNSKDNKCIGIFLSFIGGISLESYISNGLMMKTMMIVPSNVYDSPIFEGGYLRYGIVVIVGFMLSLLTNRISKCIKNYL